MYYVQCVFNGRFRTFATFPTYDKALRYVKECVFIHEIPCSELQIVHKGMVLTINERSLYKVFK